MLAQAGKARGLWKALPHGDALLFTLAATQVLHVPLVAVSVFVCVYAYVCM